MTMLISQEARFFIGQIVYHKYLHSRGVVIDVDFQFLGSDTWYRKITHHHSCKKQPWYHVLVDNTSHRIYAPENALLTSTITTHLNHPLLDHYFSHLEQGYYHLKAVTH